MSALAGESWTLLPAFLVRSTGFAFEPFDALRLPDSQQVAQRVLAARAALADLQGEFTAGLFTESLAQEQSQQAAPEVFALWYRLKRCVQRALPCPQELQLALGTRQASSTPWISGWNRAVAEVDGARQALATCVSTEFARARARLSELIGDARFQEALLLSNPQMFAVAVPAYLHAYDLSRRAKKIRQLERQFYAYLQRFCTKNETTSFFGPIDYGWIDRCSPEPLLYQRRADDAECRRWTRLSFWAAQALAECLGSDPAIQAQMVPCLQHGCTLLPGQELEIAGNRRRLPEPAARLLQDMQERPTAAELCRDDERRWSLLRQLQTQGVVLWRLEIPTAVFDPLSWLIIWLEALPAECATRQDWLSQLQWFQQALASFTPEAADAKLVRLGEIEQRFTQLTALPARRGEGQIYVDRLILYDEAQGPIEICSPGTPFAERLQAQLRPTLDLCASFSQLVQEVCQQRASALFLAAGEQPQPYLRFVRTLHEHISLADCLADPRVRQYQDDLSELAGRCSGAGVIRLTSEDLRPFQRQIAPGTALSPDILLAAPDPAALRAGDYQIVIGEIHYGVQVWCHFLSFSERRAQIAAALERLLPEPADGALRAMLIHRRTQGKTFPLELPGYSVEVAGRSTQERGSVLPVADLEVAREGNGRLILRSRSLHKRLELYAADPRSVSNWLFGSPSALLPAISTGAQTPRIEIEGVVYQRARWTLSVPELLPASTLRGEPAALLLHASQIRQRFRLPERVFARVPSERKPLYVDFANIFSLELFLHFIRNDANVTLSEVCPTPQRWWLRGSRGTSSCEWRMTSIYGGVCG